MTQPSLFDTATVDVERLARALFIHVSPLPEHDAAASWDSGKAARQSWIGYARNVIHEMGWQET